MQHAAECTEAGVVDFVAGPPRPPARPKPAAAAENSRAMDPALASVTWADLERISPLVWRRATRLARQFGYDY